MSAPSQPSVITVNEMNRELSAARKNVADQILKVDERDGQSGDLHKHRITAHLGRLQVSVELMRDHAVLRHLVFETHWLAPSVGPEESVGRALAGPSQPAGDAAHPVAPSQQSGSPTAAARPGPTQQVRLTSDASCRGRGIGIHPQHKRERPATAQGRPDAH